MIKIGCVGPITGDQAGLGLDQLHALRIAVDEANAKGEIIPGYRIEIVSLDDQHNPSNAVAMAKRLAADPDVLAVVGHVNSSCSLAAAPVYQNARMAQISPSSSNPEISRKGFDTFSGPAPPTISRPLKRPILPLINLRRERYSS